MTDNQREVIRHAIRIMDEELHTMRRGMGVAYNYEGYTNKQELDAAIAHRVQIVNSLETMIQETT